MIQSNTGNKGKGSRQFREVNQSHTYSLVRRMKLMVHCYLKGLDKLWLQKLLAAPDTL